MSITVISVLCGITGMIGWGVYDFLGGVYAKQIGPFKSLFWSQLAGLISTILLLFLFATGFEVSAQTFWLLLIAGILYSAGYLFFFRGFEIGNVSTVAAAMNLWPVFTMTIAFFFMGQRLSSLQTLGVFMILTGVTFASINWKGRMKNNYQLASGVRETVIGAFFFGVYWNISEIISEEIGWLSTTILTKFLIILFLLLFSNLVKREIDLANTAKKTKYIVVLMGIIEAGAVTIVNYGLTIGDAILITPIASALSVVTIFLAIIFLKDKITTLQGLGITSAIAGIIVTAF
ncbi:MAG TPA: hypothetical protein DCX53_02700 [Anaerolineae bacterium]|nr:hypothetical protein [Anaerolineae bacterium]